MLACLLTAAACAAAEPAFQPLFPKDGPPPGWVIKHWADVANPAQGAPAWTVKDGVLTSAGDRGCWFISEADYGDFELEYEFRLGPRGNSGLALRAPAKGDPAFDGMEMQMADFRYNPAAKPSELTGGIYRAIAPSAQVYQPEQWNKVTVSLIGAKLKIVMNDKVIHDTDLATHAEEVLRHDGKPAPTIKDRPRRGHLGFQNLSRDNGQVEIRNARIRSLAMSAVADDLAMKLPELPAGIGHPAADRAAWEPLAATPDGAKLLKQAAPLLKEPMPAFAPDLYQEYYANGNRTNFQNQNGKRWSRLRTLTKAECLEGKRRFVPALDEAIRGLCGDPSWCLPAHDYDGWIFEGKQPYVDLAVAMNGFEMATTLSLLADRLPAPTVELARKEIERRLTGPILAQIHGKDTEFYKAHHWWSRANHNWNAVCTAGGVGAILLTTPSRAERAEAISWAEGNMKIFLSGFAADGYCTEGIGYWSFGFGHFAMLSELVLEQTQGAVNWLESPRVRQIAAAALGLEVCPGIYPAFADAAMNSRPSGVLVDYLGSRGLWPTPKPLPAVEILDRTSSLYEAMLMAFPFTPPGTPKPAAAETPLPIRCWLPEGGVHVGRPSSPDGLAVAWKGGNNAEHHNHNDVGTTMVFHRGQALLCDPGAMVYTAETFGKDRYRFPAMSSYGHSTPVVDGCLQLPGKGSQGRVLNTAFSELKDQIRIDLRSCYRVEGLKKLEREWTFTRAGTGELVLEDRFEGDRALDIESALIGLGTWQQLSPGVLAVTGANKSAVAVAITSSHPTTLQVVRVLNPGHATVMRLGIRLAAPQSSGWIRASITPATAAAIKQAKPLPVAAEAPAKLPAVDKVK